MTGLWDEWFGFPCAERRVFVKKFPMLLLLIAPCAMLLLCDQLIWTLCLAFAYVASFSCSM